LEDSARLHAPATLLSRHSQSRRLVGTQSQSERCAEYTSLCFARNLTSIPTHRPDILALQVKVTVLLTVNRCLGVRCPSGIGDQFFFLLEIFFRQLRVCYFVAHSLTRGRVCNLLLLLVLANAVPDEMSGGRDIRYNT
jgi:hypothetical protein